MDVKAGALVIQFMRGGERVTKEDYENNRKVKNAKNKSNKSIGDNQHNCLLYTSPSPRDKRQSRMPSSA